MFGRLTGWKPKARGRGPEPMTMLSRDAYSLYRKAAEYITGLRI
jgi:hypothetical protein